MKKSTLFFLLLVFASFFNSGCKRDEFDPEQQLKKDEQLIKDYLAANQIAAQRHESGVYYVISSPGEGETVYTSSTSVTVKYKLRLLGGQEIPQTTEPISFELGGVIAGWQIGVPLIEKGGKIRLFVPSGYAYGQAPQPGIPANSVLDFDIELLDVVN